MNAKKKNKKPTKPNPTQKAETETEKVDEVPKENPEILLKSEERVPEIISAVPQVIETNVSEPDTPKKPKRNRGKKKKSDKDDTADDEQEIKPIEPIAQELKVADEVKSDKNVETTKEKTEEVTNLTPATRKKKNKNKKTAEQLMEEQRIAEQELNILPIKEDDVKMSDVKIVTLVPVITETEQESKASKKKNKKKKRNDSERSDKAEEAIICTSAFQKLLEPKEEKKELKQEECMQPATDSSTSEATVKEVDLKQKCVLETKAERDEFLKDLPQEQSQEMSKDESGKGKKKNKKDKKHPPKPENEDTFKKPEESTENVTDEKPTLNLTDIIVGGSNFEQTTKNEQEIRENPALDLPVLEKEKSPKPKAKIAKPVEKKRKEKSDVQIVEALPEPVENVTPIISTEDKTMPSESHTPKEPETKEAKPEAISDLKLDSAAKEQPQITTIVAYQTESIAGLQTDTIQIPSNNILEKKRNKSPKQPKRTERMSDKKESIEPNVEKLPKDIQETIHADKGKAIPLPFEPLVPKDSVIPSSDVKCEIETKKSEDHSKQDKETVYKAEEISEPMVFGLPIPDVSIKMSETAEKTEPIALGVSTTTEIENIRADQIQLPETGMGKKKKKSPKMPKKILTTSEVSEETEKVTEPFTLFHEILGIKQENKEKIEISPDLPPLEDIEIRSVKAEESEGSSCDIVPDVQYPRAASQIQDDNNNMVIREVLGHEAKLNIPILIPDTPFIEGSGETPTPEIVPTDVKVTEINATLFKPDEKTDLKSKVLEVNQDMEELRVSIERSLAELTSMEMGEKETEVQFEKVQAKIDKIKEIAAKSDSSEGKEKVPETSTDEKVEKPKVGSTEIKTKEFVKLLTEDIKLPEITEIVDTSSKKADKPVIEATQIESIECIKQSTEPLKFTEPLAIVDTPIPPVCPARKDNKGKGKSKKKGKQETEQITSTTAGAASTTAEIITTESKDTSQETKKEEKTEQKSENTDEKGKQQTSSFENESSAVDQDSKPIEEKLADFVPIENFEDAMTSSLDDVNRTFEMIANEGNQSTESSQNNPEISVTAPIEDEEKDTKKQEKVNPVSPPKNLRGHPDIPVRLNKTDYKKEKNKTPNTKQAKVKIKDAVPIEINKESKESQTENKRFLKDRKSMNVTETISSMTNENEEYVYKYSFRKVYLPSACHVCKKDLKQTRVPCNFCSLVFYCNQKHKDEDYVQHQAFCFAVSTIVHLKDQKHIYTDSKDVIGHSYRLLRMQMIVSCEKVLKRKLVPWEQEALLYPRMCGDVSCREWRQAKLKDCEGCGQISYCSDNPDHLPKAHQRWCKSYSLYQRLVCYQQTKGRLEPKLPSRVMSELYQIPDKMNEVLASMYEEKIDMNDIQYAALTQIATAPLTAAYCQQLYSNKMNATYANGVHKKSCFTIHVVGAELQFEADALNKWEVFFLHLRPDVKDLRVVLIGPELNPSNLPLDLLGKIKLCESCRQNKRRVLFDFQDKKTYSEYWSTDFAIPDLVCTFNPSIQRSSIYNGKDTWPSTIKCILKFKVPFVVTSYTVNELQRDLARIKECSESDVNIISEPKLNTFASVRPDRNFISDDEMPLLFKNYCFMIICGAF